MSRLDPRLRISVQISKELRGKIGSKAPRRGKRGGASKIGGGGGPSAPPRAGGTRGGGGGAGGSRMGGHSSLRGAATGSNSGGGARSDGGSGGDGDGNVGGRDGVDGGEQQDSVKPSAAMGTMMAGMAVAAAAAAAATSLPDISIKDALKVEGEVRTIVMPQFVTLLLNLEDIALRRVRTHALCVPYFLLFESALKVHCVRAYVCVPTFLRDCVHMMALRALITMACVILIRRCWQTRHQERWLTTAMQNYARKWQRGKQKPKQC